MAVTASIDISWRVRKSRVCNPGQCEQMPGSDAREMPSRHSARRHGPLRSQRGGRTVPRCDGRGRDTSRCRDCRRDEGFATHAPSRDKSTSTSSEQGSSRRVRFGQRSSSAASDAPVARRSVAVWTSSCAKRSTSASALMWGPASALPKPRRPSPPAAAPQRKCAPTLLSLRSSLMAASTAFTLTSLDTLLRRTTSGTRRKNCRTPRRNSSAQRSPGEVDHCCHIAERRSGEGSEKTRGHEQARRST
mmetsp:Transcript_107537/g.302713  ORF Transcript_107537/g.302713 Transcript_107537/m.302713 type:complete len:247 (+) Transcript_107537:810-1550(+)